MKAPHFFFWPETVVSFLTYFFLERTGLRLIAVQIQVQRGSSLEGYCFFSFPPTERKQRFSFSPLHPKVPHLESPRHAEHASVDAPVLIM